MKIKIVLISYNISYFTTEKMSSIHRPSRERCGEMVKGLTFEERENILFDYRLPKRVRETHKERERERESRYALVPRAPSRPSRASGTTATR